MRTAMILCAGYGTRLKKLTRQTPKPMLPIQGKPMLEYTLMHLSGLGIKNIIINLHYLSEQITTYFGDGKKWDIKIRYSHEQTPMGTAGAVKNVEALLKDESNFFVLYGDVICNENYSKVYKFHKRTNGLATIIIHQRKNSNSIVKADSRGKVIHFLERPEQMNPDMSNWVNSGLYIFNNAILKMIPENDFCDFPRDIFPNLVSRGGLYAYPLTGYRCAIDSPARYKKVQSDFNQNKIRWNVNEFIKQNQPTSKTIL